MYSLTSTLKTRKEYSMHSPIPWAFCPLTHTVTSLGSVLASLNCEREGFLPESELRSNGKLIAGAPNLLRAAKDLVRYNSTRNLNALIDAINDCQ